MELKTIISAQYHAGLGMLRAAIEACPEALWYDQTPTNPTWLTAIHTLFYAHYYLGRDDKAFIFWEKWKSGDYRFENKAALSPYTQAEALEYLALIDSQIETWLDSYSLEEPSGFDWIKLNKFGLQLYSLRHIMLHTGELFERIGAAAELPWIGY